MTTQTTPTPTTTSSPVVRIVNAVALVLGHGCALDDADAARLPSLRAWSAATEAAAIAYNDALPADEGWRTFPEGWGGEWIADRAGRLWAVEWTTGTGRLRVEAGEVPGGRGDLTLTFSAGPRREPIQSVPRPGEPGNRPGEYPGLTIGYTYPDGEGGRIVAILTWAPGEGWRATRAEPALLFEPDPQRPTPDRSQGGPAPAGFGGPRPSAALAPVAPPPSNRVDRLGILHDLDRQLGGEIVTDLRRQEGPAAAAVLAALQMLAEYAAQQAAGA